MEVQSISPQALKQLLQNNEPLTLIDVREPWEHQQYNIGGQLVPMDQVMQQAADIPSEDLVVLYCQKGIRSSIAIQRLQRKYNLHNLVNLAGGMNAWQEMVKKQ